MHPRLSLLNMHINLKPSRHPKTAWWKLLLLVIFSAGINYALVLGLQYARVHNISQLQPLLHIADQYNPDYQIPNEPYSPIALFNKWDSFFYVDIAQNGYTDKTFNTYKRENWAFYPLYPGFIRLTAVVSNYLSDKDATNFLLIIGMLFSNVFFFLALITWQKVFRYLRISQQQWHLFLALLLLFPVSYVYHFVFTESLFLFLSGVFLLQLAKHNYLKSAWVLALLTITRITGIIYLPVLLISFWFNHAKEHQPLRQLAWVIGFTVIALTPFLLFHTYLGAITGEPMAAFRILKAWDNAGFVPFNTFIGYLNDYGPTIYPPHFLSIALLAGGWVLVLNKSWKTIKQEIPYGSLQWGLLLSTMALLLANSSIQNRNSIFRYTTTIPYLYLLFSEYLLNIPSLRNLIIGATLCIFGCLHVLFLAFFMWQIPIYSF